MNVGVKSKSAKSIVDKIFTAIFILLDEIQQKERCRVPATAVNTYCVG
jgi:hypothetical protein